MTRTDYDAPHYVTLSIILLLLSPEVQTSYSAHCSEQQSQNMYLNECRRTNIWSVKRGRYNWSAEYCLAVKAQRKTGQALYI